MQFVSIRSDTPTLATPQESHITEEYLLSLASAFRFSKQSTETANGAKIAHNIIVAKILIKN